MHSEPKEHAKTKKRKKKKKKRKRKEKHSLSPNLYVLKVMNRAPSSSTRGKNWSKWGENGKNGME